jgi:heptosyltransferase-2
MQKILIIKTGAAGDVVRTTTLFNILKGSITWVIEEKNQPLFPGNLSSFQCITIETAQNILRDHEFDLILSLEEDEECARLASTIKAKKRIGIYWQNDKLNYTHESRGWFNMSLCSVKGPDEANALKKENPFSYQHWLFNMLGKEFTNEPYHIYRNASIKPITGLIGIEKRSGKVWPNKTWAGYNELAGQLKSEGFQIRTFQQRASIREYMDDIAACSCIISGDTLAMHLAIAYQIPCISIFNCTSPAEIHSYDILKKIVSPMLYENFYSRAYSKEVVESVSVKEVHEAFAKFELQK